MKIKSILISAFIFLSIFGNSQTRRFKHITSADGISQSEVYTFLEDSRGYMWFGTVDGLNRYDGYEIEIFNTDRNEKYSLNNNTIRTLEEDKNGRIWIGTDDGLNVYDPKTELIYPIIIETFINQSISIWAMLIYDDYLLIGTSIGLYRTNIKESQVESSNYEFQKIANFRNSNYSIRSLKVSKEGGIWVLTPLSTCRLVFQHSDNEPVVVEGFDFDNFSNTISSVEDLSGNLWISSSKNGLLRYSIASKRITYFQEQEAANSLSSNTCSSLALDNMGNLWIGTEDKGLNFIKSENLNGESAIFESVQNNPSDPNSLNSNLVYSLYVTKNNQLWVGTIGSGINIHNPQQKKFEHYKFNALEGKTQISNFIRAINIDDNGRILAGTHNNGLFMLNRENGDFKKLGFQTLTVFHIEHYKQNKFFICTGRNLSLIEIIGDNIKLLSKISILNESAVFYITKSSANVYWYAALEGLVRVEIVDDKIVNHQVYSEESTPAISANNCRILYYNENRNELLVGTEGGGLNIISLDNEEYPLKIQVLQNTEGANSLSNNFVRSIIKDKKGNLWIGTYEGLNKLMQDSVSGEISFKTYTKKDGLPNNMIQLIAEDNQHCLWIGTNGGLSQFFPDTEKFINYTVSDGVQSNEFSEHTVYLKEDGEILIGGINGINAFYPDQIKISSIEPQTTITDFYLFNNKIKAFEKVGRKTVLEKSITLTDSIKLLPKQKNLGFKFSAMLYPNAEKIKYQYKLEGFDEHWHVTDAKNRNANYTNLKHGKYVFKVKSTNTDGIWQDDEKEIFIHIQTPFKYTWAARILYFLIVVSIFTYFSHYTIIRYTTKKNLLLEKNHNEKLHELDVMRTKFFINISHDLRTPLTLIRGPLENILQNKSISLDIKENLLLIKRNVKRLNYLVEQLLDVRKAESGKLSPKLQSEDLISFTKNEIAHFTFAIKKKGLHLNFTSELEVLILGFDPAMISKVYFNIISNAIKFTERGQISISIKKLDKESVGLLNSALVNQFVQVEIRDTGIGLSEEQKLKIFDRFYQDQNNSEKGYGIGLSHSKELIDAHNGFIEAESTKNEGTIIRFYLPIAEVLSVSPASSSSSTEDIYFDSDTKLNNIEKNSNIKAKSILVVEDNIDMQSFIRNGLKKTYNIISASDGLEGLVKAKEHLPDLIVCDVMMPNMDGIELCEKIKSNIEISHIPFILLTAKVDFETKYEGIETGADDFIPKPFEMEYLLIRIKNLLKSRELLQQKFQKSSSLQPSEVTVTSVDEKFLSALVKAVEEGISNSDFSISSLESTMGMSHANFYRKIKSLTGQSGQELLQNMRMKRAHQILRENKGMRISEVAYMVGFTNPKYFSKCFKATFGQAPSELLK